MSVMNELSHDVPESETADKRLHGGFWKEIIKFTFIALVIVVPFRLYVAQPFIVSGASMDPTFADGEYLVVDQISKQIGAPDRESVVIFRYPKDPSKFFIKRIIGLPGETVKIDDGVTTIVNKIHPDGFILDESYVANENKKHDTLTITLGEKEYFVLGDNRRGSLDSRAWGPVPERLIVGQPFIRILPLGRLGFLPGDYSR